MTLPTRLYKSDGVQLAQRGPAAPLRDYVRAYTGWSDEGRAAARRRHVASAQVPLIVNLDADVRIRRADARQWAVHRAFVAGPHDVCTVSESAGRNLGLQIDFTVLGARLFLGCPLAELTNLTVDSADVLGASADAYAVLLSNASTWGERFAVLDAAIAARIAAARPIAREIRWVWRALTNTAGEVRIAHLRRELGWSERRLATTFRRELGLTPKSFARVLRFQRAVAELSTRDGLSLTDIATACGYFDQAHFNHDVRRFAGVTPSELLATRSGVGGGFSA
jgi:AraC-like DNA-binding protein